MDTNSNSRAPLIIGILIAVAIALGAWYYLTRDKGEVSGASTRSYSGEVTAVDLTQMASDGPARISFTTSDGRAYVIAVPSMGRPLCAAKDAIAAPEAAAVGDLVEVSGAIAEDGSIVPCESESDYLRIIGVINDTELSVTFPYRKGPNGYVMEPVPARPGADPDFVKGYTFMLESDYRELQNATEPREGPPTIQMRAYRNPSYLTAALWPGEHPRESNIELALSAPVDTLVGGEGAVRYTADGLYATDTYVVTSGSYIYLFTGAYIDENSVQRTDFNAMIRSVAFIGDKG